MGKKALITGATGWLGQTLIPKLLEKGYSLRVLLEPHYEKQDVSKLLPNASDLEIEYADFANLDADLAGKLRGISTIFHAAAALHPKNVSGIYAVNTKGTALLAQAATKAAVEKFIFVSSCSVHGSNLSTQALSETDDRAARTHYAKSKALAEDALLRETQNNGLFSVIVRPGVFYGSKPSRNMTEFMEMIRSKPFPIFGKHGFKRTYVDVENVADSLLHAEAHGKKGEAYLIGDEEPLSTEELITQIATGLGTQPRFVRLPPLMARGSEWFTVRMGQLTDKHLRVGNIVGEFGRDHFFTSEKAKKAGFRIGRSSADGLVRMGQAAEIRR